MSYVGMTPSAIEHWCDNEWSVIASQQPPTTPSSMISSDADLMVLAIH
jgi:hypothetical protein